MSLKKFRKKNNEIPPPNKYARQYNWSMNHRGNKFPTRKRVSLLEEIMQKSKESPGPLDYALNPKRKIKGNYKSSAPRDDLFGDAITNSMDVPPPNIYIM